MNQPYLNHSYLISAVDRFQELFFDYSSYFNQIIIRLTVWFLMSKFTLLHQVNSILYELDKFTLNHSIKFLGIIPLVFTQKALNKPLASEDLVTLLSF